MKKFVVLAVIAAVLAAMASLATVAKGWKWNQKRATPVVFVSDGWTWDRAAF